MRKRAEREESHGQNPEENTNFLKRHIGKESPGETFQKVQGNQELVYQKCQRRNTEIQEGCEGELTDTAKVQ